MRTGAKTIVEGLEAAGCETLFGLPGGAVLDIFAELYHSPIKFVLARHEQGATHMADGYARATGRIGCCIVTSGPGATNAVTGLATAFMDGVPMVCISGQVPSSMIGNDAFQEADTVGITRAVTKHNYIVRSVDDIPRIIAEAFHIAGTGKPGPVLVDIPKDIQRQMTNAGTPETVSLRGYRPVTEPQADQVARLVDAINEAEKPLFYVGGGAIASDASEALSRVAQKGKIPVTTTLMGLGAFPETDPLALRMLGMHGSVAANRAVSHCDLLVSLGARFDDRVTGKIDEFAPHAKVAHVDIDPSAVNKNVATSLSVIGDVKQVMEQIIEQVEPRTRQRWLDQVTRWKEEFPFCFSKDNDILPAQYVIQQVYEVSKGDAIITTDVGQHQMWAAHFFKYTQPRTFISSGGLGTMGFGLPAAIGAQLAKPEATVVNIAGDGSIQMNVQELVVAVEHQLPVVNVILNNDYLGMVRQWQEMFYNDEYAGTVLGQKNRPGNEKISEQTDAPEYLPDFVALAKAHGADGARVSTRKGVAPALKKAFESRKPWVLEFIVEPQSNVYPMVPPGKSLMDMVLSMV